MARRLTVLQVAFPLAPVGPDAVGGAEQVLAALDARLVRDGHRSLVLAAAGSRVEGELLPLPAPPGRLDREAWVHAHEALRPALAHALATREVDVVHLHGVDFASYLPPPGPPALVTLHLPATHYAPEALRPQRPLTFLHPVSSAQRRGFPAGSALLDPVENGVALERFSPARRRRGYALALGRLCAPKGQDLALAAARRAGVPLVLAGDVYRFPEHLRWFEAEIRPRLGRAATWAGPVGGGRKRRLLAGARCVVVASRVDETCSLVALEALASGTPVVAFRRGALPELVEDGRTGFLVEPDDVDALAEAIRAAGALRSEDCRAAAEARFSLEASTGRYLTLYGRLARLAHTPRPAAPAAPRATLRTEPVTTLERLEALATPWRELWARAVAATPFTHPAWLLPWSRTLATAPPRAVALWRGRELAALAPTFLYQAGAERVVGLLGGAVSDYQDVLAEGPQAAAELLDVLADAGHRFDRAALEALPAGSPLLAAAVPEALRAERLPQDVCPVLPLNGAGPDLGGRISDKLLADVASRRRRLERSARVRVLQASARDLADRLADLFRLHRARWSARGGPGVLDARPLERFHAQAAPALLDAGLLRLLALQVDGRTVAVLHAMAAQGRAYAYLSGLDPAWARASPGSMLFLHLVALAQEEGLAELDFLRGREAYKYRFGPEDRPTYTLLLTPAHRVAQPAGPLTDTSG